MSTQIATTLVTYALGGGNQRKVNRTSNGVLWVSLGDEGGAAQRIAKTFYSVDGGVTFLAGTDILNGSASTAFTHAPDHSFYIDQDDYAHVVFKDNGNGYIYYRRGTPNAGRTAWTWSAAVSLMGADVGTAWGMSDIVAHREGTGWVVHIVTGLNNANNLTHLLRVTVSSTGTIAVTVSLSGDMGNPSIQIGVGTSTGTASNYSYPSIDFHHTGDGKAIKGGTPHLYVTWNTEDANGGTYFTRLAYSAGTWGSPVTTKLGTHFVNSFSVFNVVLWDGNRLFVAGMSQLGTHYLYESATDAAPFTTRAVLTPYYFAGTATYDADGNIYYLGNSGDEPFPLRARKWNRTTNTFDAADIMADYSLGANRNSSFKRGVTADGRQEFVYLEGTGNGGTAGYLVLTYGYIGDPNPGTGMHVSKEAYGQSENQNAKRAGTTSNGNRWVALNRNTNGTNGDTHLSFHYSTDGISWFPGASSSFTTYTTTFTSSALVYSFHIDIDDYCHVVYKDMHGALQYRRGTPNAARTAWTWTAPIAVSGTTSPDFPDIVAHREGTGWVAHIVTSGTAGEMDYYKVTITSAAAITVSAKTSLFNGATANTKTYPSIDFHHIGDGKTIKDGLPHLFVGYFGGQAIAGKGIRCRKAVYSGGTWTWNADREIDALKAISGGYWLTSWFDGTRWTIGGFLIHNGAETYLSFWDRNEADTTTSPRYGLTTGGIATAESLTAGGGMYDAEGNVYAVGMESTSVNGARPLNYWKYTRSAGTWSKTKFDIGGSNAPNFHIKKYASFDRLDLTWSDNAVSPYYITHMIIQMSLSAKIKVWLNGSWVYKTLKRWNGTAWVAVSSSKFKRWDGSAWVKVP